ncbi:MAG: hypothetical protein J6J90_05765 [Angelakisella sp.]|nr:hypothetical protein [Angelakisella sp.]
MTAGFLLACRQWKNGLYIIGSGKSGGYFVAAGEGPAQDMGGAAKSEIYAGNKAKKTCIQPFGMIN